VHNVTTELSGSVLGKDCSAESQRATNC